MERRIAGAGRARLEREANEIRGHDDVNRPTEIADTLGEPLAIAAAADIVRTLRAAADASSVRSTAGRGAVYVAVQRWPIERLMRLDADVQAQLAENVTPAGPGQWITLKQNGVNWSVVTIQPVGSFSP